MRRKIRRQSLNASILILILAAFFVVEPERRVQTQRVKLPGAVTFTVTTNLDDTPAGEAIPGSLRGAIIDANTNPGPDFIVFAIAEGPQTISPLSPLPTITDPVVIDGTTQPGFSGTPLITISGGNVGGNGLHITGGSSTVKSLIVNNFANSVVLENGGGNVVTGSNISSFGTGITINNSPNNRIGGATLAERNFINANSDHGIQIIGITSTANRIVGNYVGLAADGVTVQRNFDTGVFINGAPGNQIGGALPGEGNVISGTRAGTSEISKNILIAGSTASGNSILGNTIGPRADGNASVQNRAHGIYIENAPNTFIGVCATGASECIAGNLISGNFFAGITITGVNGDDTLIVENNIGTNAPGTAPLNNGGPSVDIQSGVNGTVIGGTTEKERNIIINSLRLGEGSSDNVAKGNFFGTDVTGTVAIGAPRAAFGFEAVATILIHNSSNNTVDWNLISGNNGFGIYMRGTEAFGNKIRNNGIGTDASRLNALRNNGDALHIIDGAHDNVFGSEPEPDPNIPGNGTLCIADLFTAAALRFNPASAQNGNVEVELRRPFSNNSENFIAQYVFDSLDGTHKIRHERFYGRVDANGRGFGQFRLDVDWFKIFDNNASTQCTPPRLFPQTIIGTNTFGRASDTGVSGTQVLFNLFNTNAHLQDLSGTLGTTINKPNANSTFFRDNFTYAGLFGTGVPGSAVDLDRGANNSFIGGQFYQPLNLLHPAPPVVDIAPDANRGLQPPVHIGMIRSFDGLEVLLQVRNGPPNALISGSFFVIQHFDTPPGVPVRNYISTGLEVPISTDQNGNGNGSVQLSGAIVDFILSGNGGLAATSTIVTNSQSAIRDGSMLEYGDTSEFSEPIDIPGSLIVGRAVTQTGRGISRALVKIKDRFAGNEQIVYTNTFGYFVFHDVRPFRTYDLTVTAKRYDFDPVVLLVDDDMRVNVVANPPMP